MEELEQALLFLLYTIFSKLSLSLHYKVFGKTENHELGARITEQALAFLSVWRYFFLYRILVQVLFCTVEIIHAITFESFLFFGKRSSCIALSGSSCMRTVWKVRRQTSRFLSKTRSISKASIFLFWLHQVPTLLHRRYFLGMSHLNWDATPVRGSAATNLWAIVNCHRLLKETGLGSRTTGTWCLRRKATGWSSTAPHFSNKACSVLSPIYKGRSSEVPALPSSIQSVSRALA